MKRKKSLSIVVSISIIILLIFTIWVNDYYKADYKAINALKSNEKVKVERNKFIVFSPANESDKALIFYPGGKVQAEAYAPLCRSIAENGYKVIIVPMPFKLAVFSPNAAKRVQDSFPEIKHWAIGGHSLGGVMAATYAYKNKDIKALLLYASYPQNKNNLENYHISALSIWGSDDGVADIDKIKASKIILPKDSLFVEISGGNHGNFGSYGMQKGDSKGAITNEEQLEQSVKYSLEVLKNMK